LLRGGKKKGKKSDKASKEEKGASIRRKDPAAWTEQGEENSLPRARMRKANTKKKKRGTALIPPLEKAGGRAV